MKTILKSLMMAALFAGLGSTAYAQGVTNVNADITASAEILSALTLTKNTDINFGTLSATTPVGGEVYLSPTGANNTNTGVTTSVGKFTLAGQETTSVKVSWPATLELTNGDSADDITYSLLVHGQITDTPLTSISLGAMGTAISADVTLSTFTVGPEGDGSDDILGGRYFLFVGGSLGTLDGQATGTYTATANFTVEYN